MLLCLFATACGSDEPEDAQVVVDEEVASSEEANSGDADGDTTSDTGDADSSTTTTDGEPADSEPADTGDDAASEAEEEAEPPPIVEFAAATERDCAHSVEELGGGDAAAEEEVDVPLPPAEKPDVDATYLVPVDELITTDLIEGTGRTAAAGSAVSMQYVGVLADGGEQFDASWDRGAQPFEFTLGQGQVIAGWDDGIEGMKVGGRRVLQIPSAQAYGEQARGDVIGANADLVFIVDLLEVSPPAEPAPPIDGEYLGAFASLEAIDLVEGEGCEAREGDVVFVHYVGVGAEDGVEFDSSWGRGQTFGIVVGRSQVIDGWNDGIAGMKVGGQRILQIPGEQAYGEGDLVFRVHLERLTDAPAAHVTFDGDAPDETEVTTLIEGTGEGAAPGDIVDTNIVVMLHNDGTIVQSSWVQEASTQLALQEGALLPGLEEAVLGTKVGELRQIILPPNVAYPDGIPPNVPLSDDDALVFMLEPVRILPG